MKNIWRDYWKGQTYNASALSPCDNNRISNLQKEESRLSLHDAREDGSL